MYTLHKLQKRHSVRSYALEPLPDKTRDALRAEITDINTHEAGLNFQLLFNDSEPFRGFTRSYGMLRDVSNYLAAVIDPSYDFALERAGYFGEQFVMKCVDLGLGTCFVSGTFSRGNVSARVAVYEELPFLIPFGISADRPSWIARVSMKLAHKHEMTPRDFFDGNDDEYAEAKRTFPWLDKALAAVACAPSALNRRPVRLSMKNVEGHNRIVATLLPGPAAKDPMNTTIDLGIAKFNVAAVVPGVWEWGNGAPYIED